MRVGPRTFLSHCLSARHSHLRHYCYFYFTRFVSLVLYLNFVHRPSPHPRLSFAYPSLSLAGPSHRSHFYNSLRPYGTYPRYVRLAENLFTTPMPHTNSIETPTCMTLRCFSTFEVLYCSSAYFLTYTLCLIYVLGMVVVNQTLFWINFVGIFTKSVLLVRIDVIEVVLSERYLSTNLVLISFISVVAIH